ncbi:MAG TPA: phage tail tape measure protein, partial [Acidothermaceae bacterium]
MATSSSTKRVTVILAGSAAGLEKTFTEASVAADAASKEMSGAFEVSGEKTGGAFKKLSSLFAGIPVLGASFAKMGEAVDGADTKSGKFFTNLANVGKIATVAGVAGLAAAGAESIHLAEKYQTATATLQGSANISAGAAKQIGDAFLGTGFKTIFSAQQQMQAFSGVAAQLGTIQGKALDAAQAQQFMAAAGDLAEGSSTDLGTTTAALAATMQAFHISTSGAASAADELFNAARFTNTGIGTVSTAVDKLHARLGVAVPSLTDTTALMTELGEHGVVGTKGITTVSTALTTLLGGSKATSAELTSLGVHVFDAQGKFVGMQGVIAQLGPKLAMMSQQSQLAAEKTLFGASAAQIMGQVMQGGVAGYDAAAAAVSRTGSAATAAAAQNQTLGKQIDLLKAGAEDLGVKFGQWLIPKMEEAAKVAAKGITWLEQHKQVAEVLAGVIGGALVVAIAAYTVSMIAAAAATVAATWPVLAIIAAVAAVGV